MPVTSAKETELTARREQVAREDLVMFINACFACTGQREFYSDSQSQRVSIAFLHQYILVNYRLLYARSLAVGINHFNQAQIILNLLATGRGTLPEHRAEEGALIAAALRALPPHRAWRILQSLRARQVNNRRARAIVREYLSGRPAPDFEAVKYRSKVRAALRHTHLNPKGELGAFLFRGWQKRVYQTPLLESFRQAHYVADALYRLLFTVAEGLAAKHNVPRDVFLERIAPQLTHGEKLRLQKSAVCAQSAPLALDGQRLPLTRLALYALSLTGAERAEQQGALTSALHDAARQALRRAPLRLDGVRVAAVLDASFSSSGSTEKRRRPLAVALAVHFLLQEATSQYRAYWTSPAVADPLFIRPQGQTDLASPLLNALTDGADLIVIVSDGCENDPPRGASEILRVLRTKLDTGAAQRQRTSIVHANPVFDPEDFTLRTLSPFVPTVGLRDAEDLPTMLGFARFAEGTEPLAALEAYLAVRAQQMLVTTASRTVQNAEEEGDD